MAMGLLVITVSLARLSTHRAPIRVSPFARATGRRGRGQVSIQAAGWQPSDAETGMRNKC